VFNVVHNEDNMSPDPWGQLVVLLANARLLCLLGWQRQGVHTKVQRRWILKGLTEVIHVVSDW
jgi:hypothetical protein